MRAKNPFSTITSSGMLLPIDLLVRIADGNAKLPGLTPDAYHLRSGERLNEAASRAWTQCKAAWDSFRRKLAALPASDTGTTLTRNEWLLPLFQELDYGRLQPKPAIVIDEKTYPVSHRWEEHVPIHLLSARYALDKRTAGVDGAASRSPYSMVQELLNRSGKFRWGMVSNGLKLYLLRQQQPVASCQRRIRPGSHDGRRNLRRLHAPLAALPSIASGDSLHRGRWSGVRGLGERRRGGIRGRGSGVGEKSTGQRQDKRQNREVGDPQGWQTPHRR